MNHVVSTPRDAAPKVRHARDSIQVRLNRFARLRTRFDAVRGITNALAFTLIFVWIVVVLDSTRWLADSVRWSLIIAGYVSTMILAWRSGIGAVVHSWLLPNDREKLARDVENRCSHFQESLLACVGLRKDDGSIRNGSEVFLSKIEQQTAEELSRLSMSALFPWNQLRSKLLGVAIGLATMLLLCFIPSLRFPERLKRAVLPLLDLAPVSIWHIDVLEPSKAIDTVPAEQFLLYSVKLQSFDTSAVLPQIVNLEWSEISDESASGWSSPHLVAMSRAAGKDQIYSVSAPVGKKRIRYRVLAADASTVYRFLDPVERPKVLDFQWTISPPHYAKDLGSTSDVVVNSQTDGDISLLQGSALKLQLTVNQEMQHVSLLFESENGQTTAIELKKSNAPIIEEATAEQWNSEIPNLGNGRFQVHLTSKTKLKNEPITNSFRPWYSFKWLPDAAPIVEWAVTPKSLWRVPIRNANQSSIKGNRNERLHYWVIANSEIIELPCQVIDDYPIESLEYEISINEEPWKRLRAVETLASTEFIALGRKLSRTTSNHLWDALLYKFETTDRIQIRAVATDRAGQKGTSQPLTFSVAASDLSSDRYAKLLLKNQLSPPLRELQVTWNANREAIQEALRQLTSTEIDAEDKLVATASVNAWLNEVEVKLSASQQLASTILPQLDSYIDQVDLELLVKGIDQLKSDYVSRIRESLSTLSEPSGMNGGVPSDSAAESRGRTLQRAEELLLSGGELATQMRDFQQDLIGLGLQSGLTKDAMYLRKLQANAVPQSGDQLVPLARSQLIVSKITESVLDIVRSTRSDVPKGLAERLEEWSRWVNDARSQILDILEQLESNSDQSIGDELKRRVAADAEEWKYRSWLFHLDGGLFWSTQSRRKDVDFRTENIDHSLHRMIELSEQLRRIDTNKELSSSALAVIRSELLKERDLYSLVLMNQIQARREHHQFRSIQNQDYPADLGLTKRALAFLLDPNRSATTRNVNESDLVRDLRTVLQSYRVLDAAHQAADAKLGVERLMEAERYDFSSLSSQLDHILQWSAVSQQLEVAHRKMQRANFPDGLHDQYNGLRWRNAFTEANQKFSLRMDPSSTLSASITPELEELIKAWSALDLKAKPFVEEARNALRKLIPSIPELAAEAMAKNKELESKTQELTELSDGESQPEKSITNENKKHSNTEERLQSLAKSELALESATEQLRESLADEAARQNLLDSNARKQARDSDAALGMIERAQANLEQAMQSLNNAESPTREAVADALRAEKRMETTLQAIQERFNQEQNISQQESLSDSAPATQQRTSIPTNDGNDPADSRTASESEMDAGYQKAEQLDALSQRNKEELLRDLEQQLKTNPIMREELQAIAEAQQQSLSNELQSLSKSEKNAARELENSDPRTLESKRERAMEMRMLANYAERLGLRVMERAMQLESSSSQKRSPIDQDSKQNLQNTLSELQQAINQAGNLNEQTDAATLEGANKNLESALQSALNSIKPIGDKLKEAADKPITDPKSKKEALKQVENHQKQFAREAKQSGDQLAQQWQREIQNQSQRFDQAKKELDQARNSRAQSQRNAIQKPDDSWAQEELRRKTVDVDRRTQNLVALEKSIDQLKERSQQLDSTTKGLQARESSSPKPNPNLGLAAEQIDKAVSLLEVVAEMAKETSDRSLGDSAANAETLTAATQRQKQINQAVDRIQEELQRNARHQDRMEQTQTEKSLENYQNRVEQLKNETLAPLQSSLAEAATQTDSIEKKFSQENREADVSASLEKPSAQNNIAELNEASEALRSLGELIQNDPSLAPSQSKSSPSESQGSSSSSDAVENGNSQNSREDMLRSRDRAQLLDRLDRMVFSRGSESSSSESAAGGNPVESSLRNAANQIASRMNQQRSQKMQASNQSSSGSQQSNSNQSKQAASSTGSMSEDQRTNFDSYFLPDRDSESKGDWGKLRKQAAEQNLEGSREAFDPDFDQAIQAYFRTLQAEGAK